VTDTSPAPIALQLYTLRDEASVDFPSVISRVGAIGFVGVELAGLNGMSAREVRTALDGAGLQAASAHVGLAERDAFERELDDCTTIGATTAVIPFAAPDWFADRDAVARTADRINEAATIASEHGITIGYHNHFWELEQRVDDMPALVALFDRLDPEVVAEVDVYWSAVGGVEPSDLVRELGDRVTLLHVKDGPADGYESPMVAVGDGSIDIERTLAAAPKAKWHIVELDRCDTDMMQAVERSYDYLVGSGLSRGRL
jgi:sugar phosphate isomerase/epimerase